MANDFVKPVVIALVFVLSFKPMSQAIDGLDVSGFSYAEELTLVLDPLPLLIILGAVIVLGNYLTRATT